MTQMKDLENRASARSLTGDESSAAPPADDVDDMVDKPVEVPAEKPSVARGTPLRRVWLVSFLVFFLLPTAWAVSTPYNGAYDEHHHVVRAAGVVRGQILVPPVKEFYDGGYQNVPRSLVPPNWACMGSINSPASCLGTPSSDRTLVKTQTGAARYNPTYYAVVGWPLLVAPTMKGIILTRIISAFLCAVLLAFAVVTIWPMRRFRLLMVAMICSTTPMLMSLNGLVNPSGLEIDAAILLWAALIRILTTMAANRARARSEAAAHDTTEAATSTTVDVSAEPAAPADERDVRRAVILAIVASAVLALGRPAGVVVVAAVVATAFLALVTRSGIRTLLRRRDVRIGAAVVAAATTLAVIWVLISRIADFGADARPITSSNTEVLQYIVLKLFDYWIQGTVGLFGYGLIPLPTWVIVAWGAVQSTLVLLGAGFAKTRRHAYTILAIPVVCFAGGVLIELVMVRKIGYFMQGRYFLPLWVGMFFLAALAIQARLPATALRRIYAFALTVWSGSMLLGLFMTIRHFRFGSGPTGYPKNWLPPLGLYTPYAMMLAGIALMVVLTWWYVREAEAGRTLPVTASA